MLLKEFDEKQRKLFIQIANQVVMADGVLHENEKKMIEEYRREMLIEDYSIPEEKVDIKALVSKMGLSERKKRILMFELIGLALCDENYNYQEKEYIENIRIVLNMSEDEMSRVGKFANETIDLYLRLNDYLNE